VLPARRYPHILCLTANEKDFSLSLEMTIWGKQHSRIVSLLRGKSVRQHSPPFPWKGLPSAARRGWLSQQVEKEWKEAFPRFVIPSAAEGSFSFPVSVFFRNAVCMKHRPSDSLEARCFPLAAILTSFA